MYSSVFFNYLLCKVDIILDWEDRFVEVYINETRYDEKFVRFYNEDVASVDKVMLYNLSPDS